MWFDDEQPMADGGMGSEDASAGTTDDMGGEEKKEDEDTAEQM